MTILLSCSGLAVDLSICVCVCVFTLSCLNNGNKKKERRAKYEKSDLSRDAMQLLLAQAC